MLQCLQGKINGLEEKKEISKNKEQLRKGPAGVKSCEMGLFFSSPAGW